MKKPFLYLIHYENLNIFEQLQKEEALLRLDHRNICLLNTGSKAAIVLGISGNADKLINQTLFKKNQIPLIRRFSGGGTVLVNEETLFITFICNAEELRVQPFPKEIYNWSKSIYEPIFEGIDFKLLENDYVIGNKKFGGNAQYLSKNRWLHHSSLLYDYKEEQMNLLNLPEKVPKYRQNRPHENFLCRLNAFFPSKDEIFKKMKASLEERFEVKELVSEEVEEHLLSAHRKATVLI